MLRLVSSEGLRIPDPPLPQRSIRILWDPAAQPHTMFYAAHFGFRRSLRPVLRLRGSFVTMEKVILPRPSPSRWLYI